MNGQFKYHVLAFVVIALWGVTFISTKVLISEGLQPSQIFALRFVVAYLGIWFLCRNDQSRRLVSSSLGDELLFVLLGVSGGSLYFLTENTALVYTQACNVSFIVCSAPLLTTLLTLIARKVLRGRLADGLQDVKVSTSLVLGTVLALTGMAAVLFDGNSVHLSGKGEILAFCAALCWAVYSIFMSQMTEEYGAVFATRKVFFYGLLTIIPFIIGTPFDVRTLAKPDVWGNLLFLSLVASLGCFVVWNKVMAKIGNVTSTNYIYLNPFFTLVFAVILLGETLTLQSALGCLAIVGGVIIGGIEKQPLRRT